MAKVFTITPGLENLGAMKTGGQGSVYKGRRIGEIITAIKILPTPIYSETAEDKNFTSFQNEVQKLKKVNVKPNPNVVKILSSGIADSGNLPFIEMEYIEGPDLEELLQPPNDPIFSIKEVIKVADHLSHALAHCHNIDVTHGDIKSNNVKFNIHSGNYVLLDFGLAVMSDEQRRTSFRHAGAIEFMAPEQSEGHMISQSDVYSFGVIIFELLAGIVPFPLKGKSESARNQVVIAHMETLPPDVLFLRQQHLPEIWPPEKKEVEMQVPEWLTSMIYKCLEKKLENRFKNGKELHEYIWNNSIRSINVSEFSKKRIKELEQENARLRTEREHLQQQLLQNHHKKDNWSSAIPGAVINEKVAVSGPPKKLIFSGKKIIIGLILFIGIIALIYTLIKSENSEAEMPVTERKNSQFKINVDRAFLYNEANENTRSDNFVNKGNNNIAALSEKNNFIYTEINSEKGGLLKGWLRKEDLIESSVGGLSNENPTKSSEKLTPEIIAQLQNAKAFLNAGKLVEGVIIYNTLSKQEVPEAMYYYAKLALQNMNKNLTCKEAFELLKKASDRGYSPAKRTLGFIYSFADNKEMLQESNYYDRCAYRKNVSLGAKMLMEAMLEGDTTASRLVDILNVQVNK